PQRDIPPAVLSISPQDHQTSVAADDRVRIVFDADMDFNSGDYESGKVQLLGPDGRLIESGVAYDVSARELVILPVRPLDLGATYTIQVAAGGLADVDGRRLATETTTSFQTTCAITLRPSFRRLLASDPPLRSRLGCPSAEERVVQSAEESFEGGHLLWRSDSGLLLMSFPDGGWA